MKKTMKCDAFLIEKLMLTKNTHWNNEHLLSKRKNACCATEKVRC